MKIDLPLTVTLPRKKGPGKRFILNLNDYRVTYWRILNDAKQMYVDLVRDSLPIDGGKWLDDPPYIFTYTLFPKDKRLCDVSNACSIIDKFAADALVKLHVIPDDSREIIPIVIYLFGAVDKQNPRCELRIQSLIGG